MQVTAWDRRRALGTGAFTAVAFVVALLLSAVTDEGAVPWIERIIRTLPAAPLCAALATMLTLRTAARRGEILALASVGVPTWRAAAPIALGAALPAVLLVGLALSSSHADVHAFYPRIQVEGLTWDGSRFVDVSRGIQVLADGTLVRIGKVDSSEAVLALPFGARAAVLLALVFATLALPLHIAGGFPDRRLRAGGLVLAAVGPTIVLFQLAAQAIVPALWAALPALVLLLVTPLCYRSPR